MYLGKRIGVVVPAYKEQRLIGKVISTMPDFVDCIYIVDDKSPDATSDKVRLWMKDPRFHNRLKLIVHEENRGAGASIVTGYEHAVEDGMEVMVVMDGDAQMNPNEMTRILEPACNGRADFVKGNRFQSGQAWDRMPRYRYFGNACLAFLTRIASGYWHVGDSQTGYTALTREAVQAMPMRTLYSRYGYPNHLLIMLAAHNFRVVDVPIEPIYDIGEVSGIRLKTVVPRMSWLLLRQFIWRLDQSRRKRWTLPVFMYGLGALCLMASIPLALFVLFQGLSSGSLSGAMPAVFGMTASMGVLAVLQAMLSEYRLNRMRHAESLKPSFRPVLTRPVTPSPVLHPLPAATLSEEQKRAAA